MSWKSTIKDEAPAKTGWKSTIKDPEGEMGIGEQLARGTINSLPMIGGLAGGASSLLGGPTAPLTVAGLAAGGAAAGESLKRGLNAYLYPDEAAKLAKETQGMNLVERLGQSFVEPAKAGAMAAVGEGSGMLLAKGLNAGLPAITPALSRLAANTKVDKAATYVAENTNLNKIQPKLADWAEKAMAKALGAERGSARAIINEKGLEGINEVGRYGLDNKLLGRFTDAEEAFQRNATLRESLAKEKSAYLKAIDKAGASNYNAAKTAEKFQEMFARPEDYAVNKPAIEAYDTIISDIMKHGNKASSLTSADNLRKSMGEMGKFHGKVDSPAAKEYQRAYGAIAEAIDKSGVESATAANIDPISLKALNKKISTGIGIENLLTNAVAKQNNNAVGLRSSMFAAPMVASGNLGTAAASAGAIKTLDKLGQQNLALTLESLAKFSPSKNVFKNYQTTTERQKILPYLLMMNQNEKDQ